MNSLMQDVAFIATGKITRLIVLDEENYRIVWGEIYEIMRAALECYEVKMERRLSRLDPSNN
jgi:hypothetical protein